MRDIIVAAIALGLLYAIALQLTAIKLELRAARHHQCGQVETETP